MVKFRRVEEGDPSSVTIVIFGEDDGAVLGDVAGPMVLGEAFSQEITGPVPIDQAFAAAGEIAGRYGCEIVVRLAADAQWDPAWGDLS